MVSISNADALYLRLSCYL